MATEDADSVWLFSYGTLRHDAVQLALFGRLLEGRADSLPGYRLGFVEIRDPAVISTSGSTRHLIVRATGDPADAVSGAAFRISRAELAAADAYEVAEYSRIESTLASGIAAFVYVDASAGDGSSAGTAPAPVG